MTTRKLLLWLSVATMLTLGLVLSQRSAGAATPPPAPSSGLTQTIDAVQSQVDFHVRTAGFVPLTSPKLAARVKRTTLGGHDVVNVDVTYAAGTGNYVTITTMNRPSKQVSERFTLVPQTLGDGRAAQYLDNGAVQTLSWTAGNNAVQIVAARTTGAYSPADLIKIADALK